MTKSEQELRNKLAFTGTFWHTEESAIKSANNLTKLRQSYFTAIKGKPHDKGLPNNCWAVTDRFCPRFKSF